MEQQRRLRFQSFSSPLKNIYREGEDDEQQEGGDN